MRGAWIGLVVFMLSGCAGAPVKIDKNLLMGGWTSRGGSFEFAVQERTILYEFDMQERPYRIEGDTVVVDWGDQEPGEQRWKILGLTADELKIKDLRFNITTVYSHPE